MKLILTVDQIKQAIADYVNKHPSVNTTIKPTDVDFKIDCTDSYGEGDWLVSHASVNLTP